MAPKPEPFGVEEYFLAILHDDKNLSVGIAAIKTLLMMLKMTEVKTMQGLRSNIQDSIEIMLKTNQPITAIVSGSDLFSRFITLGKFDDKSMDECRAIMLNRGQIFLKKLEESRQIIATKASPFITDGCKILTHSRSRAVLEAMIQAKTSNKRFHVYVTKDSPDNLGDQMVADLTQAGIECTAILDSATGYVMESVDFVMVGAEGVVESGGIINKVGSFTIGLCALEMKKPFYVLAESFKFTRLYPLNQRDLPNDYKFPRKSTNSNFDKTHPLVDYTPPAYITLLFTDLGILTPSAISDELIKLYL